MKQSPTIDHQDGALEVPECDLVDWDLHETSLYIGLSWKNKHKTYIVCEGL